MINHLPNGNQEAANALAKLKKIMNVNDDGPPRKGRTGLKKSKLTKKQTHKEKHGVKTKNVSENEGSTIDPRTRFIFEHMTTENPPIREFKPLTEEELSLFDEDLDSIKGIDDVIASVRKLVLGPLKYPQILEYLGTHPIRGILLHGPPGSGKTCLARAIAKKCQTPFFYVNTTEVITSMSGESEAYLRELFQKAKQMSPSIIFLDELDAIIPKRETAGRDMERRLVSQLSTCMDSIGKSLVIVLAATNRIESIDLMIRRNGRFDQEIAMPIPDKESRRAILGSIIKGMKVDDISLHHLAALTPGCVASDLKSLCDNAALIAISRGFQLLQNLPSADPTEVHQATLEKEKFAITSSDFEVALADLRPSSCREGFTTVALGSWDEVGALMSLKEELKRTICNPIRDSTLYRAMGIKVPSGVLLYGPPGCGKTLLAKAVAHESNANFISVKGPELLNKYVGESERAIRQLFQRARTSSPCIVFFDELDSVCSKRGTDNGTAAAERVVNQLLTEMDGVEARKDVFVIAATNRPDTIDPAMLRPGRLERILLVPLPPMDARLEILRTLSRNIPLAQDVELEKVAEKTHCYSGADLHAVLREAGIQAIERFRSESSISVVNCTESLNTPIISFKDLEHALTVISPSVTEEQRLFYENL